MYLYVQYIVNMCKCIVRVHIHVLCTVCQVRCSHSRLVDRGRSCVTKPLVCYLYCLLYFNLLPAQYVLCSTYCIGAVVEHVFDVTVSGVRGLSVFNNTVWGEADCFVQYHFPRVAHQEPHGEEEGGEGERESEKRDPGELLHHAGVGSRVNDIIRHVHVIVCIYKVYMYMYVDACTHIHVLYMVKRIKRH